MRKIFLLIALTTSLFTFSQETLMMKSGGRVFTSDNQKISPSKVRALFATNGEALNLYNIGRTQKTVGNLFFWGGLATVAGKFIYEGTRGIEVNETTNTISTHDSKPTLYIVAGAMLLVSIPIKIGFQKKIKKSIELYNQGIQNKPTSFNFDNTTFVINQNGAGIKFTF